MVVNRARETFEFSPMFEATSSASTGLKGGLKNNPIAAKMGGDLAQLHAAYMAHLAVSQNAAQAAATFKFDNGLFAVHSGYVVVDAVAKDGNGAALLASLEALGLQKGSVWVDTVSGLLPVAAIDDAALLGNLNHARASMYMVNSAGSVANEAEFSQKTDVVSTSYGVDGTGITVGVISDSFDASPTASDSYADNIASGDLPAGITILEEIAVAAGSIDEGRAMAQLIYDIAPGAGLAFHTAFNGLADFATGITELAAISDIVVDDIIYFAEPMFQDGIVAQAADAAFAAGVPYFSSAGNQARSSYESDWRPVNATVFGITGVWHDFDPGAGVDTTMSFTLNTNESVLISFQWDEPYFGNGAGSPGASSDIDIGLFNNSGTLVASSTANNINADPVEIFQFTNAGASATFHLVINLFSGPGPGEIKFVDFSGGTDGAEYHTNSGASYGHASAEGALGVGAAFWGSTPFYGVDPARLENFSSAASGVDIKFNPDGTSNVQSRDRVDFTAVDGSNNTFFINDSGLDPDSNPNFFGTSAAAPNAAAVAALALEAFPGLSIADLYDAMRAGTLDIQQRSNGTSIGAGFDDDSGWGLIQADLIFGILDDDFGSTTGDAGSITAGPLELGNSVSGEIEMSGDADWFEISLVAGVTYNFVLQGNPSGLGTIIDPILRLRDSGGVQIAISDDHFSDSYSAAFTDFVTLESMLQFTASSTGTYYLDAQDLSSGTGTYLLSAVELGSLGVNEHFGSRFRDSLEGGAGSDVLNGLGDNDTLLGGAGFDVLYGGDGDNVVNGGDDSDFILFDSSGVDTLTGGGGNDLFIAAEGSINNALITDLGAGDRIIVLGVSIIESSFSASFDGVNTVITYDIGDGGAPDGFFRLAGDRTGEVGDLFAAFDGANTSIALNPGDDFGSGSNTLGMITPDFDGDSVTGVLEVGWDQDWFKATLTAGRTYNFDLIGVATGGGTLPDPYLRIFDSTNQLVAENDDHFADISHTIFVTLESFVQYRPTITGAYYISAGGFDAHIGTYTLTGVDFGEPILPDDIIGSRFADQLDGGPEDQLIRGLDGNDTINGGDGLNYIAPGGGDDIAVGGANDDFFQLGRDQSDTVVGADGVDTITGGAGDDIVFGEYAEFDGDTFTDFSAGMTLFLDGAEILASSFGASFAGGFTTITFDIGDGGPPDGSFLIDGDWTGNLSDINATYDGFGTFIFLNPGDDYGSAVGDSGVLVPGPLVNGASVTGNIEVTGDQDWFAVSLTAGVTYNFDVRGSDSGLGTLFDTFLTIYDSSGVDILSNDDHFADAANSFFVTFESFIQYTPTTTDTFYVGVRGLSTSKGTYTLTGTDLGMLAADLQYGGVFADSLDGGATDDTLSGLQGDDSLHGFDGMDILEGGDGDDYVSPGAGQDSADGGAGVDAIDFSNYVSGGTFDMVAGTADLTGLYVETFTGFETLITTLGDDFVDGTANADNIQSGHGDDTLKGGAGADSLFAGFGDDRVEGAGGEDFIKGGPGKDTLLGGGSDDVLGGSNRSDLIRGDAGRDLLLGSNGNDRLFGGAAADTLLGGNGRDTLSGDGGPDRLVGGAQVDVASYESAAAAVWVRMWAGDGTVGDAAGDVLIDIENIVGSDFNDTLQGDSGANRIEGGEGDDLLWGLEGDDTIVGAQGDDRMLGHDGDDLFLLFGAAPGDDEIADFTAGAASEDVVRLIGFGAAFDTFAEVLAAATQVGVDTVINFGVLGTLTLEGVTVGDLHADDFIFG